MDLVLIRHPAVAIDAGVCYGRSDVPLAGDPEQTARTLQARFAARGLPYPGELVTSPLSRCAAFAAALARDWRVPLRSEPRLREIDFGAWELLRWDAIGRAALARWNADLWGAREHGGESVAQFASRVEPLLPEPAAPGDACAYVTHAGVMRVLAARALDAPLDTLLQRPVAYGGVIWLRADPAAPSGWRLGAWDEA
jgi:alpha-ribazole phosphatase